MNFPANLQTAITESHTRSSTTTSTDDIYPLTFTHAAAQPGAGTDTQHVLRNIAWNEAAKMSGQRGPECKFRHVFNFVWAKAPNHVTFLLSNTHGCAVKTRNQRCKDNLPDKNAQMSYRPLRRSRWRRLKYALLGRVGSLHGCAPCKRCLHTLLFKTLRCVNMLLMLLFLLMLLSLA